MAGICRMVKGGNLHYLQKLIYAKYDFIMFPNSLHSFPYTGIFSVVVMFYPFHTSLSQRFCRSPDAFNTEIHWLNLTDLTYVKLFKIQMSALTECEEIYGWSN
jgi:hypothetical protein